jgi:hypothetical protein
LDKNDEHKEDSNGHKLYRIAKHTIEEFHAVTEKYGIWKSDLESFAKTLHDQKKQNSDEETDD